MQTPVAGDDRFAFSREAHTPMDVRAALEIGHPKTIWVDRNPEFVSKELSMWAYTNDDDVGAKPIFAKS